MKPSLRERLREWWRVHYMERGFGVFTPGYARQAERDERDAFHRIWGRLQVAYPPTEDASLSWYIVFRGAPFVARTYEEAIQISRRLVEAYGVPAIYAPRPRCLHTTPRPLHRRKSQPKGEAS